MSHSMDNQGTLKCLPMHFNIVPHVSLTHKVPQFYQIHCSYFFLIRANYPRQGIKSILLESFGFGNYIIKVLYANINYWLIKSLIEII